MLSFQARARIDLGAMAMKGYSAFRPVKLLVSYRARAEGLVNMEYTRILVRYP